ncbi:hypothetical protein V8D89_006145, partial [Ganoderma adspersum]
MLTSLKELYLFDNHLQTLPPKLGTLHQLQMPRVIVTSPIECVGDALSARTAKIAPA